MVGKIYCAPGNAGTRTLAESVPINAEDKAFTNADKAKTYTKALGVPCVVKADGLAAGKGVIVCTKIHEALDAIDGMRKDNRIFDNDEGPNTGGMGDYSPAPVLDHMLREKAMKEVMIPAVQGIAKEGTPL